MDQEEEEKKCYVCYCKRRRGWKCPNCKKREVHFYCMGDWIKKSKTCPLCRHELPQSELNNIEGKTSCRVT